MRNQKGMANLIVLVTVILIVAVTVGIIAYTYKQRSTKELTPIGIEKTTSVEPDKTVIDTDLVTKELPSGDIKIINNKYGVEMVVPVTYNLTGDTENYAVSFHSIDPSENAGPKPFASLQIRKRPLIKDLYEEAKKDYEEIQNNNEATINLDDIKTIKVGEIEGYYYNCPFLVKQQCIYIPIKGDRESYLFLLKSFSDEYQIGYENELNEILDSLKYTKIDK